MNGPTSSISSSLISSLYLIISFTKLYLLSLSLPCSTISLLSLPQLDIIASLSNETQAGASSHTTPRHINSTHTLRLLSTNTATWTWPTTSTATYGLITAPHSWACHAIHHVIGTSHHRISLNQPAMVGFAFRFVWFRMGFEVWEWGGLWVSYGSGTMVVAAIWWLWWLFFGLLWFFFFLISWCWWMGLCRWWLSMLLQQWLLVAVVAVVVNVSLLLLMVMTGRR